MSVVNALGGDDLKQGNTKVQKVLAGEICLPERCWLSQHVASWAFEMRPHVLTKVGLIPLPST